MKKRSLFQNIKEFFIVVGKSIKSALKRGFRGTHKELSLLEEEAVQSPLKTVVKKFFSNKIAIVGLVMFIFVLLFTFGGSMVIENDIYYQDITQGNTQPGFSLMSVPKEMKKNGILDIAVGSTYSMGIDKQNNVYIWGLDIKDIAEGFPNGSEAPMDLKTGKAITTGIKAKRVWSGFNHFILEQMDGTLIGFGTKTESLSFGIAVVPTKLAVAGRPTPLNIKDEIAKDGGVLEVVLEDKITLVITKEHRVFWWGNTITRGYNMTAATKDINVVDASFSRADLAFLKDDGTVKVVGSGSVGTNVPAITDGKQLITTRGSAIVLKNDGTLVGWGDNLSKELDFDPAIQGRVVSLSDPIGLDGHQHVSAVLDDGSVVSWGSPIFNATAVPKDLSNGTKAKQVFGGFYQSYAVDGEGKLLGTWGLKGYLFGTDSEGRNIFERVMNGGKITLTIGLVAVLISTLIGIIIGGLSGFYGGKIDILLMRLTEIVGSIPFMPIAMTFAVILNERGISDTKDRMLMIMVILGILSWTGLAKLVRAQILSEREKEFVTAAKALGVKEGAIIFKHIIPNVITIIIVSATLGYASSLLTESGLSFLGFGVKSPAPSWGNMLTGAQNMQVIQRYWWRWVFPSVFLCIATISINLIGDALRDAVDPRSSER